MKGAPERVIKFCKYAYVGSGDESSIAPVTPELSCAALLEKSLVAGKTLETGSVASRPHQDANWASPPAPHLGLNDSEESKRLEASWTQVVVHARVHADP